MRSVIFWIWILSLPIFLVLYSDGVIKLPRFDLTRFPFRNLPATNGLIFACTWIGLTLLIFWLCSFLP